jgi:hypothetical protein
VELSAASFVLTRAMTTAPPVGPSRLLVSWTIPGLVARARKRLDVGGAIFRSQLGCAGEVGPQDAIR